MGKAYWSKSMVVARLTGVPYRQNDLVMSAVNGRILIRSLSVDGLSINEDSYVQLLCKPDGRLLLSVMDDPKHLLNQHVRYVKGGTGDNQGNMYLYARQQVRQACMKHGVKELRCRVKSVVRVSGSQVVAELVRVDDMAEMYGWAKRGKKKPVCK